MILDHILSHQRSPHDKTGIGFDKSHKNYEEGESPQPSQEKIEEKYRSHKDSREKCHAQQGSRRTQSTKKSILQKGPFNSRYEINFDGFLYACSGFCHTAMDCTFYGRRSVGIRSNTIRCWTCDQIGHFETNCHTLRCFTCGGFGHKAQVCASPRIKSMRSLSYPSTRKVDESWKKNNAKIFEDQRSNDKNQIYS